MKKAAVLPILFVVVLLAVAVKAEAQQPAKIPRIGILTESSPRIEAFRQGLRDLGDVEGKDFAIEQRSWNGRADDQSKLAAELVDLKVAVIVTTGTTLTQTAKKVAGTIPIVMTFVSDPIGFGFVASLARPGGNITGLTNFGPELGGKRLELLKEIVPKTSRVVIIFDPAIPVQAFLIKEMQAPAAALGIKLLSFEFRARGPGRVEQSLLSLKNSHPDALMVLPSLSTATQGVMDFAMKHRLPTTYHWKEYVEAGASCTMAQTCRTCTAVPLRMWTKF
ncbi:MAG: hypothetical protein E6J73_01225 [Deltaproteobacteria bacterium]|nr:MAG: hypothetical protein E6J73_01225 [Deltaproteobacteria bacterium]